MKIRPGLHRLVRQLSLNAHDRCTIATALAVLICQRRRVLRLMAPALPLPLPASKRLLWGAMAAAIVRPNAALAHPQAVLAALQRTQAWHQARIRERLRCSSPFGRGRNYRHLLQSWRQARPDRLVIFHHYDPRGWLPRTWIGALSALRHAGWTVVVSTSGLQHQHHQALRAQDIQVAERRNQGLCLGAYKDLVLLLQHNPALMAGLGSLVLCNDSTLPVGSVGQLIHQLEAWHQSGLATDQPRLAGLTDSVERGTYHLQSYLLHANAALLQSPFWLRFWLFFQPSGSKDDLIDRGELGLSQAALAGGAQLCPAYGLLDGLLACEAMVEELKRHRITDPQQINQTLFAWQSLLERGCPLVKKRVFFDGAEPEGQPLALHTIGHWLTPSVRADLEWDLQQMLISRYTQQVPLQSP